MKLQTRIDNQISTVIKCCIRGGSMEQGYEKEGYRLIYKKDLKGELVSLKEENIKLAQKVDRLTLELLKEKGKLRSSQPSQSVAQQQVQVHIPSTYNVNRHAGSMHTLPALPNNAKVISKVLYPTKKLAFSFAVFGVKETLGRIRSYIVRKAKRS